MKQCAEVGQKGNTLERYYKMASKKKLNGQTEKVLWQTVNENEAGDNGTAVRKGRSTMKERIKWLTKVMNKNRY